MKLENLHLEQEFNVTGTFQVIERNHSNDSIKETIGDLLDHLLVK